MPYSKDSRAIPRRIAAIDLGTNSVRLIVAEVDGPASYRVLDGEREQTRLGFRLQETGRIDAETGKRTLEALGRMQATATALGVEELRAIATAALREAGNGPDFVQAARDSLGLEIEVISAEREAELALRSVRQNFDLGTDAAAIVDIGGGSMEVLFVRAGTIDGIHSMPIGAVRMTERYVRSDPIDAADWGRLRDAIDGELEAHLGQAPFPTPLLIGSGGTFTAIAGMALHERDGSSGGGAATDPTGEVAPVQGYGMSRGELGAQLRRLRETTLDERRRLPGLNPDRADIIVAGTLAVARLAQHLGVSRIVVNDRGVRDGLLLEMIEGLAPS